MVENCQACQDRGDDKQRHELGQRYFVAIFGPGTHFRRAYFECQTRHRFGLVSLEEKACSSMLLVLGEEARI